jgi:hypothetical protein
MARHGGRAAPGPGAASGWPRAAIGVAQEAQGCGQPSIPEGVKIWLHKYHGEEALAASRHPAAQSHYGYVCNSRAGGRACMVPP